MHVCVGCVCVHGLHMQCVNSARMYLLVSRDKHTVHVCYVHMSVCMYICMHGLCVQCVHSAHLYVFAYFEVDK